MAIDKIILEFQAETTKLRNELDTLKGRLGNVEDSAKKAGKNTGKAFEDAGKSANQLKETVYGLGKTIAAAFAAQQVVKFAKESIALANIQLKAEAQLLTALKGRADVQQSLIKQAAGLQKITTFGDEQIIQAQSLIAAFVDEEEQIKELTRVSLDFAAAKGIDLGSAADLITKTFSSSTNALGRYGLQVEGAAGSQERLQNVTKALDGAFKGQAETLAKTGTGGIQQLQNVIGDVQEQIGMLLIPVLTDAANGLKGFFENVDADTLRNLGKTIAIVASGFAGMKVAALAKDMGGLTGILKGVTGGVKGLNTAIKSNPFGLIASAVATLIAYGPDLLDMMNGVNETQKELEEISYKATENLRKEQAELNLVGEALAKTNPGSEERARLLKKFNELSPQGIADLKDTFDLNNQLATAMASANAQYDNRIKKIGLEAAATAAAQKQIELKAKITAEEDKLVRETGMSYDEVRKSVQEYVEYQKTGTWPAFARAKNLLRGGVGDLAELQYAYDQTTQQTQRIKAETDAFNTSMSNNSVMANKSSSGFSFLSGTLSKFGQKVEETKAKWSMFQGAVSSGVSGGEGDAGGDGGEQERISEERAKKLKEIQAQFNKEMMSLADELTLMMIADEDERGRKQLEIQKKNDLASIEAAGFTAEQKGQLKAQIDAKYNQLELDRQKAQNEKLKKAEEDYQRFLEEQALQSEEGAKETENRKYSAYLELWQLKQENELLGIENERERKLRELEIHEQNEIAKVEATELAAEIIAEIQKKYAAKRVQLEKETQMATNIAMADGLSQLSNGFAQMVGAFAQISGEGAEYTKALAVIGVQIQLASSLAAAIAGATAAAAATGPGAPFVLAGYIAAMVGAVVGAFAQTSQLLSAEVPKPAFYDGTAYLQRGGNPKGKDTIPVMAHEGEAIIPTKSNLQYPGLAKSWIDGNLDGYINNNFVRPALMEQQRQAEEDFADRLAASMALQMSSNFDDYRLYRAIKEQTAVNRTGFETMKINRKKIRGGR
jgi:hypothetical protein